MPAVAGACTGFEVGLLELKGVRRVRWRGAEEVVVLDGVDLNVAAGEVVAVWGGRGAGKSTLARVAVGLEAPDAGVVRVNGRNLARLSRNEFADLLLHDVGWARPGASWGDDVTIVELMMVPLLAKWGRRRARREAASLLRRVGVGECADKLWEQLTDAQRTFAAIAHALVRKPRLLVVDDPTANLDMIDRRSVMELLRTTAERDGVGVLVTVPEVGDMFGAHRIAALGGGRLLTPSEPQAAGELIELPRRHTA